MSNLGCPQSDEQIKALIASVDTDGNGMVSAAGCMQPKLVHAVCMNSSSVSIVPFLTQCATSPPAPSCYAPDRV